VAGCFEDSNVTQGLSCVHILLNGFEDIVEFQAVVSIIILHTTLDFLLNGAQDVVVCRLLSVQ
jgi:hypothetical protein